MNSVELDNSFASNGLESSAVLATAAAPASGASPVDSSSPPNAASDAQLVASERECDGIFEFGFGLLAADAATHFERDVGAAISSGANAPIASPIPDQTLSAVADRYAADPAHDEGLSGTAGNYSGGTLPVPSNGDSPSAFESARPAGFTGHSTYINSAATGDTFSQIMSSLQADASQSAPTGAQAYGIADIGGELPVDAANLGHGTTSTTPTPVTSAADDLIGFGLSSIVWRDAITGDTGFWDLVGDAPTWQRLGYGSTDYAITGIGGVSGDGAVDLVWSDSVTGDVGYWEVTEGGTAPQWRHLGVGGSGYAVAGTGEFLGAGAADILFTNAATGDTGFWQVTNNNSVSWHDLGQAPSGYSVAGFGDFYGTGYSDILWYNPLSNATDIWEISGSGTATDNGYFGSGGSGYSLVGIGDFDGDGVPDVLWRNNTTGDTGFWHVNLTNGWASVGYWVDLGASGTDYAAAGVGDYTGSGSAEILWTNHSNGDTGIWTLSNNGATETWHYLGASGTTGYQIQQNG